MPQTTSAYDEVLEQLTAPILPSYEHLWAVLRIHKSAFHPDDEAFVKQAGKDGFQIVSTVGQANGSVVVFMSRRLH